MKKSRRRKRRIGQTVMRRGKRRKKGRRGELFIVLCSVLLPLLLNYWHFLYSTNLRESEKNYVLDEDDYELLQDNNITGFHRPKLVSFLRSPFFFSLWPSCGIALATHVFIWNLEVFACEIVRRAKNSSVWKKLRGTLMKSVRGFLTMRSLIEAARVGELLRKSSSAAYLVTMRVKLKFNLVFILVSLCVLLVLT